MTMAACRLKNWFTNELFDSWGQQDFLLEWKEKMYSTSTGQIPEGRVKYRKKGSRQKYKQGTVGGEKEGFMTWGRKKSIQSPGRLVMKIQSVTLNWEVSLAMNLLGGRQRHRQRLMPTEERELQDIAMLKITARLLFLWTWRHDWNASGYLTFTLDSFVARQQQVKKTTSCSINNATFCYQVRGENRKKMTDRRIQRIN